MKQIRILIIAAIWLTSYNLTAQNNDQLPVTATNNEALKLFNESVTAFEKIQLNKVDELLKKAIEVDNEFFMPHFQLAFYNLFLFNDEEKFKQYATSAIALKGELNNAEKLYKEMLERLLKDKKSDLTDLGAKIVKLYPKVPVAYSYEAFFLTQQGKHEEALKNQQQALKLAKNKAPFYNAIGYNYMAVNKMKEAEKAFDKYIELEPGQGNPYDSKGDYYMAVKNYKAAYDSFMKAYNTDNVNFKVSLKKAEKAKQMMESTSEMK